MNKLATLIQLIKFGLVGVSNTVVDFAVLNLLLWAFSIYSGPWIIVFNVISFTLAVINSYVWNKFWTFKKTGKSKIPAEISKYIAVSLVGAVINTGIVYLVTTLVDPLFGLSETLWANVGKLLATGIAMVWNFVGYKFWAFKSDKQEIPKS